MTLAALFVAEATGIPFDAGAAVGAIRRGGVTSKGASGVQGAAFIALVATLR